MSPSFPVRKDDPQIVHDMQSSLRDLRTGAIEASKVETFTVIGKLTEGMILPPLWVVEHSTMSGALAHIGVGTCDVELHAHANDSFAPQTFSLDGTYQAWWEQSWADLLEAGEPFWIVVKNLAGSGMVKVAATGWSIDAGSMDTDPTSGNPRATFHITGATLADPGHDFDGGTEVSFHVVDPSGTGIDHVDVYFTESRNGGASVTYGPNRVTSSAGLSALEVTIDASGAFGTTGAEPSIVSPGDFPVTYSDIEIQVIFAGAGASGVPTISSLAVDGLYTGTPSDLSFGVVFGGEANV